MSTTLSMPSSLTPDALTLAKSSVTHKRTPKTKVFVPFRDYILSTLRHIHDEGKDKEFQRRRAHAEAHNMYAGRQIGYASPITGEWMDEQSDADPYFIENIVQPTVDIIETEAARVRIDLKIQPKREGDLKVKEGAVFAEELLNDELRRIKDAFFTLRENKFAILTGDYYRFTFTEADEDEMPLRVPRALENVSPPVSTNGAHVCTECGETEPAATFAPEEEAEARVKICPECGTLMNFSRSANVSVVKAEYDERAPHKVSTISPDPLSVKISPHARRGVADSPYVWWKNLVSRGTLEAAYPDRDIPSTTVKSEEMKHQEWLAQVGNRESGGTGSSTEEVKALAGGSQFEQIEIDMVWLDPSLYAEYIFPEPTTLPSGKTAQKGQILKELYPHGLYIAKAGDELLDDAPERKHDRWCGGVFRMIPTSAHGGSISGIINDQKQINELRNLEMADAAYNGAGREIYNKSKISGGMLSGDPRDAIAAENLETGESLLTNVAVRLPGTNGIPSAERLKQQIEASVQNKTGAMPTNLSASSPDLAALGTATGITAQREASVGRMGPSQWLRSQVDEEHGYQVLTMLQECLRTRAASDPALAGDTGLKWFLEADVRRDYRIEASPGSWMPETDSQRQAYFETFLKIAAIPGLPKPMIEYAAELYKQPYEVDPAYMVRKEAQVRLEEILDTARIYEEERSVVDSEGQVDEAAVGNALKFSDAVIDIENDQHATYILFYQEWLLSAEARRSSKFARECVKATIAAHRNASVMQAAQATADSLKAQAPMLDAKDMQDQQASQTDAKRAEAEAAHAQDAREHELGAQLLQHGATQPDAPIAPPAEEPPHPAKQLAESLSLKYSDLALAPTPLQAQALSLAGIEVQPEAMSQPVQQS